MKHGIATDPEVRAKPSEMQGATQSAPAALVVPTQRAQTQRLRFHVKPEPLSPATDRRPRPRYAGRTTTNRLGSSPSESLMSPAAATASCTTFRSKGFMGSSATGAPLA